MPDGVAHTMGSDIYKEIHFSLEWIEHCSARARDEIRGVLTHEMVHCYQYDGNGICPTGFTEGVAGASTSLYEPGEGNANIIPLISFMTFHRSDWVRLRSGLAPPHWREGRGDTWDVGYDSTAYFLDWIEKEYGRGIVQAFNLTLRDREYEVGLFKEHTGRKITKLWDLYRSSLDSKVLPN